MRDLVRYEPGLLLSTFSVAVEDWGGGVVASTEMKKKISFMNLQNYYFVSLNGFLAVYGG